MSALAREKDESKVFQVFEIYRRSLDLVRYVNEFQCIQHPSAAAVGSGEGRWSNRKVYGVVKSLQRALSSTYAEKEDGLTRGEGGGLRRIKRTPHPSQEKRPPSQMSIATRKQDFLGLCATQRGTEYLPQGVFSRAGYPIPYHTEGGSSGSESWGPVASHGVSDAILWQVARS